MNYKKNLSFTQLVPPKEVWDSEAVWEQNEGKENTWKLLFWTHSDSGEGAFLAVGFVASGFLCVFSLTLINFFLVFIFETLGQTC